MGIRFKSHIFSVKEIFPNLSCMPSEPKILGYIRVPPSTVRTFLRAQIGKFL